MALPRSPAVPCLALLALSLALGAGCEPATDIGDAGIGSGPDGGADGGADAGCPDYPSAPYDWDLDDVVDRVTFPAMYGSDGPITALDMCDVLADADTVKALVFVIGTTTCPYCPARFTEIGEMDLAAYGAEKVAVYYDDATGDASLDPASVSAIADTYGWIGGWRISDTADKTIFYGGYPNWLWQTTPNVFIVDTHSMMIVAAEKGASPTLLDVLAEVQAIDAANP